MAVNVRRCREFSKLQSVAQPDAALNPTADKRFISEVRGTRP